jgi:hypothetical protein
MHISSIPCGDASRKAGSHMRTAARSATSTRFMPFKVALAHNLEEKKQLGDSA